MAVPTALRFAYDGTRFEAYARAPGRRTVEAALLAALAAEGCVEGSFRAGSRTDARVSAAENVAFARLERPHLRGVVPALQGRLPDGLWVTGAAPVAEDWNPRFHALRTYRYCHPLRDESLPRMQEAAAAFVGRHDMRAFARLEPGRDPVREVRAFAVAAEGRMWVLRVQGPSFLWNQVRRMAGAVLAVGRGEAEPDHVQGSLARGTPHPAFRLAPAEGLLLERVAYDPEPAWDPAAGALEPRRLERHAQEADVRAALLLRLQAQDGR